MNQAFSETVSGQLRDGVLVVVIDNPPVNAASAAMRAGLFAAIAPCRRDRRDQRRRDHRRRPQFRRRRRHPRIRRADGRADAAAGDRADRGERQAGRRRDQRRGAGRRPGDRARLPPSHRRRRGKARPARGEARHRAGRRRNAAPAAARRRGGCGRADRQRPDRAAPPRRCRSASSTRSSPATSWPKRLQSRKSLSARGCAAPARLPFHRWMPRRSSRRRRRRCRGRAASRRLSRPSAWCAAPARYALAEGLAEERATFLRLRDSDQAKALRHVFFAERAAAKVAGLEGVAPRQVETIGVVGTGLMGSGIAVAALDAGYRVIGVEQTDGGRRQGTRPHRGTARSRDKIRPPRPGRPRRAARPSRR